MKNAYESAIWQRPPKRKPRPLKAKSKLCTQSKHYSSYISSHLVSAIAGTMPSAFPTHARCTSIRSDVQCSAGKSTSSLRIVQAACLSNEVSRKPRLAAIPAARTCLRCRRGERVYSCHTLTDEAHAANTPVGVVNAWATHALTRHMPLTRL